MSAKPDGKRTSNTKSNNTKRDDFSKKSDRRSHRDSNNKPMNKQRSHNSTNYGGFNKKNAFRHKSANVEETVDDIKVDILRVEKEINLLIDEIKSMKL